MRATHLLSQASPLWAVQALPSMSLPLLCSCVMFDQSMSHFHAYDEGQRANSASRGTWVQILAVWLPPPQPSHSAFPSLEWEHCCAVSSPGEGKVLAVLAKGQCCLCSWAPSGPWSFCARGGQGGGGLNRQRLGLCSLLLPLARAGEARGCWAGGWALDRPSKCLAVPVCPSTGWGVGVAVAS